MCQIVNLLSIDYWYIYIQFAKYKIRIPDTLYLMCMSMIAVHTDIYMHVYTCTEYSASCNLLW